MGQTGNWCLSWLLRRAGLLQRPALRPASSTGMLLPIPDRYRLTECERIYDLRQHCNPSKSTAAQNTDPEPLRRVMPVPGPCKAHRYQQGTPRQQGKHRHRDRCDHGQDRRYGNTQCQQDCQDQNAGQPWNKHHPASHGSTFIADKNGSLCGGLNSDQAQLGKRHILQTIGELHERGTIHR